MKRSRSIAYTAASLALSLAIIAFVAWQLDWALAGRTLLAADGAWLGAALAVFLVNYVLRTARVRLLLHAPEIRSPQLMGVMMLYGMFNYLLPAKSGEISYVLLSRRYLNTSLTQGAAVLIVARLFDFGFVALVLPAVLVLLFDELPGWLVQAAVLYCVLVIAAAWALLAYLRRSSFEASTVASASPIGGRLLLGWRRLMAALATIDARRQYLPLWLLTFAIWLCVYANAYCLVRAVGYEVGFLAMVMVCIILVPLTLLPVQGVANIGAHEAGWIAGLAIFGLSFDDAMLVAVTTHILLILFVVMLGAAGALLLRCERVGVRASGDEAG